MGVQSLAETVHLGHYVIMYLGNVCQAVTTVFMEPSATKVSLNGINAAYIYVNEMIRYPSLRLINVYIASIKLQCVMQCDSFGHVYQDLVNDFATFSDFNYI